MEMCIFLFLLQYGICNSQIYHKAVGSTGPKKYRPGHVDIVCEHAADSPEMRATFPRPEYKYITIVREPWSHAKSVWHFYGVDQFDSEYFGNDPGDSFAEFFSEFHRTEPAYMRHPNMYTWLFVGLGGVWARQAGHV